MVDHPVLVLVEVLKVHDSASLAVYRAEARKQMLARGGELLARNSATFFGETDFGSLLIQRWPSETAFVEWMESSEYEPLLERRLKAADLRIAIIPCV